MNLEQNHIIEKVFFEVNTSSSEKAHFIKNNIDTIVKNELFPRLEKLFDKYDIPNHTIRFNSLKVDFTIDKWGNINAINTEFEKQVLEKLESEIDILNTENVFTEFHSEGTEQISDKNKLESTFLFFLENGYLPWFGREKYIQEFTKKEVWKVSLKNDVFLLNLKDALKLNDTAIQRFVLQFDDDCIFSFLEITNSNVSVNKKKIQNIYRFLKGNFRNLFLKFLVQLSLFDDTKKWIPTLQNMFSTISKNEKQLDEIARFSFLKEFKKVIYKVVPGKQIELVETFKEDKISEIENIENDQLFIEKEDNEIAVQNAGLIILHPFIKSFFENIGLLNSHGLIKKDSMELAVQSLHFLATGSENFFEGNLILEKFLCGMPLQMPIQKESLITVIVYKETASLLKSAIENWPELKNTSPDGLRELFIHRDGKLIQKENNYKLIAERKAQDVLLEKLKWNISILKLPWKKDLIFVEW